MKAEDYTGVVRAWAIVNVGMAGSCRVIAAYSQHGEGAMSPDTPVLVLA